MSVRDVLEIEKWKPCRPSIVYDRIAVIEHKLRIGQASEIEERKLRHTIALIEHILAVRDFGCIEKIDGRHIPT